MFNCHINIIPRCRTGNKGVMICSLYFFRTYGKLFGKSGIAREKEVMRMSQATRAQKKTAPLVFILIFLILLLFLGFFYYMAANYYSDRFPNHTTINGVDVSNLTPENAKAALNHKMQSYVLTIRERGGETETIGAPQVGMTYADNGEVDRLQERFNHWLWAFDYFNTHELTAAEDAAYDETKAEQVVSALKCFDPAYYTKTEDAHLDTTEDDLVIVPAVEGTQLDEAKSKKLVLQALSSGEEEVDFEAADCYLKPKILEDDASLTEEVKKVEKWLSAEITFDFGDDRIVTVDRSVIVNWITQNEDGAWVLDADKATEFVKTEMAYKTDTFGLTHEFKTHDGKTITLKGGDYGWCIARQETAESILRSVKMGRKTTMEPKYLYRALDRGIDDIGGTYVEISIDDQMMWCYKDHKLVVETPVVTGNVTKGNGTPKGSVWAFDSHKSPATLGTLDTMGYSSKVTYWMSFTGNVGIHDSSWRGTDPSGYGGDIYKTNGSHGCVNTPIKAAKKIFETVNVGYPVVVY